MQRCAGVNPLIDLSSNVALIYGRMDRELLRQCLAYHGEPLLNKLKCEQTENPDFQAVASDLSKATYERYVESTSASVNVQLLKFTMHSPEKRSSGFPLPATHVFHVGV